MFTCPGCAQIGRVYDDAMKQAQQSKAPVMGIKVRLLSREQILAKKKQAMMEAALRAAKRGPLP